MIHDTTKERRLGLRLLSYWEKLRKGRPMPTSGELNPDDIRDLWDHCLLINVKDLGQDDYNYTYIGEAIADVCMPGPAGPEGNGALTHGYTTVAETGKPLLHEGEFTNSHQHLVRWRQCLLPLGEDGRVDAVFGGIRFRIFPAQ